MEVKTKDRRRDRSLQRRRGRTSDEKRSAGVVRRGGSRVFSLLRSVGCNSAVFFLLKGSWPRRRLLIGSCKHRTPIQLCAVLQRPADVQRGERCGAELRYAAKRGAESGGKKKKKHSWKEAGRLCESCEELEVQPRRSGRVRRVEHKAALSLRACFLTNITGGNQDPLWLNMALCHRRSFNPAHRLHARTSDLRVNGSICPEV